MLGMVERGVRTGRYVPSKLEMPLLAAPSVWSHSVVSPARGGRQLSVPVPQVTQRTARTHATLTAGRGCGAAEEPSTTGRLSTTPPSSPSPSRPLACPPSYSIAFPLPS